MFEKYREFFPRNWKPTIVKRVVIVKPRNNIIIIYKYFLVLIVYIILIKIYRYIVEEILM